LPDEIVRPVLVTPDDTVVVVMPPPATLRFGPATRLPITRAQQRVSEPFATQIEDASRPLGLTRSDDAQPRADGKIPLQS
jgi:hypothetical protein